jgi:hypothetical protein
MESEDWRSLEESGPALGDLRVIETAVAVETGPVLIGLDGNGWRHLLVPLTETDRKQEDRASRGVQIVDRTLYDGANLRRFGDVQCLRPELDELFEVVANEMLVAIASRPAEPVRACLQTLERWRDLLRPATSRLLGPNQLVGLLAELVFVRDVVERNPQGGLDFWTGPEGARHDLRHDLTSMEVKGTINREGRVVEIHGIEQLQPPAGGSLVLGVVRFERSPRGLSVEGLRREIVGLGASEHELLEKLQLLGYLPADEEAYDHLHFEQRERRMYAVEDGFPSLTAKDMVDGRLPPGVLRVAYSIDLTNEPPEPLDDRAEAGVIAALAGE